MSARDLAGMRQDLQAHALQASELLVHQAEYKLRIRLYVATSDGSGLDVCGSGVSASGMGKSVQFDNKFACAHEGVSSPVHRIRVGIFTHGLAMYTKQLNCIQPTYDHPRLGT